MLEVWSWTLFNERKYLIPISLLVSFSLTLFCRNKSRKKCFKVFGFAFVIGTLCNYFFFVILRHIEPGTTWNILSTYLLKNSVLWSFYTMINFLILRSMWGILHLCKIKKRLYVVVLLPVYSLFIIFYPWIEFYEACLFHPFLNAILDMIPDIKY